MVTRSLSHTLTLSLTLATQEDHEMEVLTPVFLPVARISGSHVGFASHRRQHGWV